MEALKQVEDLVSAKISVIKAALTIIRLEAKLAGLSVFPLLLNVCMLLIVLMTFWLFVSLLIGYGIFVELNNIPGTLFLVVLLNFVVLCGLVKYLTLNIKNMSFEKTRSYLFQNEDRGNEQEKTIESTNSGNGANLTPASKSGEPT